MARLRPTAWRIALGVWLLSVGDVLAQRLADEVAPYARPDAFENGLLADQRADGSGGFDLLPGTNVERPLDHSVRSIAGIADTPESTAVGCAIGNAPSFDVLPLMWWVPKSRTKHTARFTHLVSCGETHAKRPCSDTEDVGRREIVPRYFSERFTDDSTPVPEFGHPAWASDVVSSQDKAREITMSAGRHGPGAPVGTMFIFRVDPTAGDEDLSLRGARRGSSAGVVLSRPQGEYSLDWVGVAFSGLIFRR